MQALSNLVKAISSFPQFQQSSQNLECTETTQNSTDNVEAAIRTLFSINKYHGSDGSGAEHEF